MSRPKKRLSLRASIPLSARDYERIQEAALREGMKPTTWMREAVLVEVGKSERDWTESHKSKKNEEQV